MLLFYLGDDSIIGKWIKISLDELSDYQPNVGEFKDEIEEKYKKEREEALEYFKKLVQIIDEEEFIRFKSSPRKENVDGRELIRYELGIRKESILPTYLKVRDTLREYSDEPNDIFYDSEFSDEKIVEIFQQEEFKEIIDYIDNNIDFIFWKDTKGFPAIVELSIKVVGQKNSEEEENKQLNIKYRSSIEDINKDIQIEAPTESMSIEELMNQLFYGSFPMMDMEMIEEEGMIH